MIALHLTLEEAQELYDVLEDALSDILVAPVRDPEDRESIELRAKSVESMMDFIATAINDHTLGRE